VFVVSVGLFAAYIVAVEVAAEGAVLARVAGAGSLVLLTVGLGFVFGRATPVLRGLLAIVAGSFSTAIVVGMRAYTISKAGLSIIDLLAVPALLGSLFLLALGSRLVLRPIGRRSRLLAIPGGLALVYYLIMPVAVGLMLTHAPRPQLGAATPADLGLRYEDVSFPTTDGVTLSGWYLPSNNGAAVALLHGAGSTRTSVLEHAALLHEAGYGALLFDSRGNGRSEGVAMVAGWYGDLDIDAAVTFLGRRPDVDPSRIGVLGLSMGGEEAIAAAASDPRIRAVVAEGAGAIRTVADTKSISGWTRYLGIPHYWVQTVTAEMFTDAPRPIALEDAMTMIAPRPILLISAGPMELKYTERYQAAAPSSTELWAPSDTPHIGALRVHPTEYRERVVSFFDRTLEAS